MKAPVSRSNAVATILRSAMTLALLFLLAGLWLLQSSSPAKGWPMLGWPNPQRYVAEIQTSNTGGPDVVKNLMQITPLDADTLAMFAFSAAQRQDEQLAASTLTIAGRMGWHQPSVQTFWLQAAIAAQDWTVAAQRMDALLRTGAPTELWQDALSTLLAQPQGLKAMAVQAANNPDWTSKALVTVDTDPVDPQMLANRLALVELAWKQGLRIDCTALAQLTNATVNAGLANRGNALWSWHCDPGSLGRNGTLDLSTSDSVDPTRSLFGWTAISSGRFSVNLTSNSERGATIHIDSSSMTSENVARRLLTLRPGKYRLSWTAAPADGQTTTGVSFLVRCKLSDQPQYTQIPTETNAAGNAITFTIAQQDCPVQDINIVIASSNKSFSSMAATVTDIRLQPA